MDDEKRNRRNERARRWREANKAKVAEINRRYWEANKDWINAQRRSGKYDREVAA